MKAMGIRIHKVLGYGLTNAKEHLILEYSTHPFWNTNLKTRDVYEWSQKLGEHQANASLIHREAPDELSDLIHYDAENGDENTLIITMPNDRWYRYDDDIDHNEYNLHYQGVEPVTTVLNHRAPYPYTFFRNVDTGENVGMDEFTSICSNFGLNGWGKHGDIEKNLKKHNIVTVEDFERIIRPKIPDIQQYIVLNSGLFKNPEQTLK